MPLMMTSTYYCVFLNFSTFKKSLMHYFVNLQVHSSVLKKFTLFAMEIRRNVHLTYETDRLGMRSLLKFVYTSRILSDRWSTSRATEVNHSKSTVNYLAVFCHGNNWSHT